MKDNELKSCLNCEFFKSFKDDYCDDLEPDDQGFCKNGKSQYCGNEGAGRDVVCEFHITLLPITELNIFEPSH